MLGPKRCHRDKSQRSSGIESWGDGPLDALNDNGGNGGSLTPPGGAPPNPRWRKVSRLFSALILCLMRINWWRIRGAHNLSAFSCLV